MGQGSKSWFDPEVRALHATKLEAASSALSAGPDDKVVAIGRCEAVRKQLRKLIKQKKLQARDTLYRKLEEARGKEYWRIWNAHVKKLAGRSGTPDAICAADGSLSLTR